MPISQRASIKHELKRNENSCMDTISDQHSTSGDMSAPMQDSHQSDTAALSLFSLRRKGVQMVLTMMLGTLLSVLIIFLIFLGFNRVEGTLNSDLTRLATTHDVPAGAMDRSLQEMANWRNILIVVAVLIASLGLYLIVRALMSGTRTIALEVWTRRMAQGDLEHKVPMEGDDEIAATARALEELRQRSIRVTRLNLVEQLASDLQAKNEELEGVLEQLRQAQDQMVTRQKLAELGELAAGVAHEIKNPLNFMRNFAEATDELLVDLREEIGNLDESDRAELAEIVGDISENLMRIEAHGLRADRIVNDMLLLGGGGGNFEPTDINGIVSYFTSLAYNGSKAMHPELQLVVQEDLDPNAGQITVIAEDVGRVVLNMVNNSCYATDEKRLALGDGHDDYLPMVWLETERKHDSFEIRVRDNGTGIDPGVIGKIFNPFFTTKPTDKGTGLGLSLANDIVREHGGTIEPKTQLGEFTEMVVSIPIK